MSKQALRQSAELHSGISWEASQVAIELEPSIYERIGKEDGLMELSTLFYNRVFDDSDNPWFMNIFASSSKKEAIENQYPFLVQTFGGPDLYRQKKGKYTRLAGRHANYNIGTRSAKRWVEHMNAAIDEHEGMKDDADGMQHLKNYFTYTAHYIVAAKEYMRPDQLSGGTKMDAGRVW